MDLVDLQVFKSVVDEGGIIKAARKLHRVPSSVTTRIKQLETSMGVTLFHRDRQRLHLSPTGELLLGYAERLIQLVSVSLSLGHAATAMCQCGGSTPGDRSDVGQPGERSGVRLERSG